MNIDLAALRQALLEYVGTAWINGNPTAIVELSEIESASPGELIAIAEQLGFISYNDS